VIIMPLTNEIRIEPYRPQHFAAVVAFVEALQDYERADVPELKPGTEIGQSYADLLMRTVAQRNGVMLMATAAEQTVGFVCVWIDEEDDMLLRNEQRQHALVSDIFVSEAWRRRGVARTLLRAAESEMRKRGCRRIRIRSKAANVAALGCYEAAGFRPYEVTFWKPIPATD